MQIVKLTNYTYLPLKAIIRAARNCRQSFDQSDSTEHFDDITDSYETILGKNDEKLIRYCIDAGHDSILEHATFTFEFYLSRSAQTQLVRHRIASFAIESMRHVNPSSFVVPDSIKNNELICKSYMQYMEATKEFYQNMINEKIPMEDARYVLPLATTGRIVYTSNLRSLRHAIAERTCMDSQWEIRKLFNIIKNKLHKIHPVLVYKCEKLYMNCKAKCGKCLEIQNEDE